ncbi:hypothetical protein [Streptomyces spongiae]|uniref:Uncharacterized protein n=1 Tax=Streptomyces spongiae TaxID=565072 RepID=A0A5N8XWY8_9ACTN|nr:hypothetical protein [Streptomyces spongiae]MPY63782.1 hypothetical protein [Streptomyces spongiae]
MHHREPPGHLAHHIPADDWNRAQATGQPVVIVVNDPARTGIPWRPLLIPFAIAGATVAGCWGLVAALCALFDAAAHAATVIAGAAGPIGIGGGITFKLARSKR